MYRMKYSLSINLSWPTAGASAISIAGRCPGGVCQRFRSSASSETWILAPRTAAICRKRSSETLYSSSCSILRIVDADTGLESLAATSSRRRPLSFLIRSSSRPIHSAIRIYCGNATAEIRITVPLLTHWVKQWFCHNTGLTTPVFWPQNINLVIRRTLSPYVPAVCGIESSNSDVNRCPTSFVGTPDSQNGWL